MFLSGLVSVVVKPKNGVLQDVIKRAKQLLVPFLVVASIFSLWKEHSLGFVFDTFKWGYWYLWVLFVYYIASYGLIGGGKTGIKYFLLFVIWFILTRFVGMIPETVSNILSAELVVRYFPYFLMGNFVKRYQLHEKLFGNHILLYLSVLIWMCSSFFAFHYGDYIVSSAEILIIMNICKKMDDKNLKINKILLNIGQNTLYIYVFHYFALEFMITSYFQPFLANYSCLYIDLLLAALPAFGAVCFSLAIKWFIEQDKFIMKYVFGK